MNPTELLKIIQSLTSAEQTKKGLQNVITINVEAIFKETVMKINTDPDTAGDHFFGMNNVNTNKNFYKHILTNEK